MKKILSFVFTAVLLLAAGAAVAAGMRGHHGPGGHGRGGFEGITAEHMAMVSTALGLTEEQKTAARQIHEEIQARAEPLQEQRRQQWQEIDQMLDAANPSAAEVGNRVIAAHAAKQQLKTLHEDAMSRFKALLTEEQRTKLDEMHERHGGREGHGRH